MTNRGYDVVVDVDADGDLGGTELHEDGLQFHSSNFADVNPRTNKPIRTTTNTFPPQNTSLPSSSSNKNPFVAKRFLWTISFYAQFFDVDTSEVLRRCQAAIFPRQNFLDVLDGNPDLYGPFWIATTVVLILFLTGTINQWLAYQGEQHYAYDFTLLSGAAGLIYGYTSIIPLALWAALKWSGSEAANVLECWSLYGYANIIWIPVAIISWSPINILNYIFVAVGLAISCLFLMRNLYPVISTTPQQRAKVILVAVLLLHAGLAIAIKILFFAHKSPALKKGGDTAATPDPAPIETDPAAGDGADQADPAAILARTIFSSR